MEADGLTDKLLKPRSLVTKLATLRSKDPTVSMALVQVLYRLPNRLSFQSQQLGQTTLAAKMTDTSYTSSLLLLLPTVTCPLSWVITL